MFLAVENGHEYFISCFQIVFRRTALTSCQTFSDGHAYLVQVLTKNSLLYRKHHRLMAWSIVLCKQYD